jgi:hypothetical protein
MVELIKFVDDNFKVFSTLDNSEVEIFNADEINNDIVEYLKTVYRNRFDYNGICVYYVEVENEIWVENMNS